MNKATLINELDAQADQLLRLKVDDRRLLIYRVISALLQASTDNQMDLQPVLNQLAVFATEGRKMINRLIKERHRKGP